MKIISKQSITQSCGKIFKNTLVHCERPLIANFVVFMKAEMNIMFLQQGQIVALIGETNSLMMINEAGKRILKFLLKIQQYFGC